jgi:hypothetical protein
MSRNSPLFDHDRTGQTRREARRRNEPFAGDQRGEILAYIQSQGRRGASDLEIRAHFDGVICADSLRARRVELMRAGDVVDVGKRRRSPSGRPVIVWIAREHVRTSEPSAAIEAPAGEALEESDAAGDRGGACPKCGARVFHDVTIHGGASIRRDCGACGAFVQFLKWRGRPVEVPREGSVMDRLGRGAGD